MNCHALWAGCGGSGAGHAHLLTNGRHGLARCVPHLEDVTAGIIAVGNIRKKIAVVKSLLISDDSQRQIAHAALDFFVATSTGFQSPQTASGFRSMQQRRIDAGEAGEHLGIATVT